MDAGRHREDELIRLIGELAAFLRVLQLFGGGPTQINIVGPAVRDTRSRQGLSHGMLAARLHETECELSPRALAGIEIQQRWVVSFELVHLAQALKITPARLLDEAVCRAGTSRGTLCFHPEGSQNSNTGRNSSMSPPGCRPKGCEHQFKVRARERFS